MDGRRDQPEGRPGHVSGNVFVERQDGRRPRHRVDGAAVVEEPGADRNAPGAQHPLRVVAGRERLAHRRRSRGGQPGQQHARFHLGARNGRDVLDAAQGRRPRDRKRREGCARPAHDRGAHRRQGCSDARHRAAAKGRIPVEDPEARQAREDSRHQAKGRPGVPAVQDALRLGQAAAAGRRHQVVDGAGITAQPRQGGPERSCDVRGCLHVAAVTGARDPALAGREQREQERTVADRLVAGQAQLAAQLACGAHADLVHKGRSEHGRAQDFDPAAATAPPRGA